MTRSNRAKGRRRIGSVERLKRAKLVSAWQIFICRAL
jgi:hypothetical protein